MMGAVSGLLVGLGIFGSFAWTIRAVGALTAIPCLYLTGSRTSWAATAVGLLLTAVIYSKRRTFGSIAVAGFVLVICLTLVAMDVQVTTKDQSRIVRSASIETMSGRTALWELALKKYRDSPIFGYGFTAGSDGLASDMGHQLSMAFGVASNSREPFSLHSGYVQALLDSGAIGTSFYIAIIGGAVWSLFRYDKTRRFGGEMYCLLFFCTSNVADTIIFGAAVSYEVFYWYVSLMSLSLMRLKYPDGISSGPNSLGTGHVLQRAY
jgi:O-antigen ligase